MTRGSPPALAAIQSWMLTAITGAPGRAEDVARYVTDGPRMDAAARLGVYRHAYVARLTECLADDYPVLARTLGPDRFEALAHAYVRRHPSASPNLASYGRHMADLCRDERAVLAEDEAAFASELAALEWSLVEVLHAPAAPPLDVRPLMDAPPARWADARFLASEAVRLHAFSHPVNRYFQAAQTMPADHGEARPARPERAASFVVAYRRELTIWRMDLSPVMHALLAPLLAGTTIGEALARVEATATTEAELEELARSLGVWFREWAAAGLFAQVVVP